MGVINDVKRGMTCRAGLWMIAAAAAVSITASSLWLATGRHYYTKFQVVEKVEVPVDEDDPFASTGFYDGSSVERTVSKDEFHFGLLPTPQGVVDRHALSVTSVVVPTWALCLVLVWRLGRRRAAAAPGNERGAGGSRVL